MIHRFVLSSGLAAAVGFASPAAMADGQEKVFKDLERHQAERFKDEGSLSRAPRKRYRAAAYHHRHGYHRYRNYRAWDGRYGRYPRRHFYVTGVHAHGYYGAPVHFATVTYRTYVYYTPTYPSLSYGYPPYAHVYSLTPGPIYNKPCLC